MTTFLAAKAAGASLGFRREDGTLVKRWQDSDGVHYDWHGHLLALELKGRPSDAWCFRIDRLHDLMAQQLRRGMLLFVGYKALYAELNAAENGGVECVFRRGDREWQVDLHEPSPTDLVVLVDACDLLEAGAQYVTFKESFAVQTTWGKLRTELPEAFDVAGAVCGCDRTTVCAAPQHDGARWDWRPAVRLSAAETAAVAVHLHRRANGSR